MTLLDKTFDSQYDSEGFHLLIEDHLPLLKKSTNIKGVQTLTKVDAYRFEYDFYAVLRHLNINPRYWWVVLRVNGLNNPTDFTEEMTEIIEPSYEMIDTLYQYYITTTSSEVD